MQLTRPLLELFSYIFRKKRLLAYFVVFLEFFALLEGALDLLELIVEGLLGPLGHLLLLLPLLHLVLLHALLENAGSCIVCI